MERKKAHTYTENYTKFEIEIVIKSFIETKKINFKYISEERKRKKYCVCLCLQSMKIDFPKLPFCFFTPQSRFFLSDFLFV